MCMYVYVCTYVHIFNECPTSCFRNSSKTKETKYYSFIVDLFASIQIQFPCLFIFPVIVNLCFDSN